MWYSLSCRFIRGGCFIYWYFSFLFRLFRRNLYLFCHWLVSIEITVVIYRLPGENDTNDDGEGYNIPIIQYSALSGLFSLNDCWGTCPLTDGIWLLYIGVVCWKFIINRNSLLIDTSRWHMHSLLSLFWGGKGRASRGYWFFRKCGTLSLRSIIL